MSNYKFKEFSPKIDKNVFVAPGAHVIGRTFLAENVNVWYNCVLRGDVNEIRVGENTNIQDLSILHVTEEDPLIIGKNVTIGHNCTIHACKIGDGTLIGMGSVILDGAVIGKNSLVAAGSVVPPNKAFPEGVLLRGSPAREIRKLTEEEVAQYSNHYKSYVQYAKEFSDKEVVSKV